MVSGRCMLCKGGLPAGSRSELSTGSATWPLLDDQKSIFPAVPLLSLSVLPLCGQPLSDTTVPTSFENMPLNLAPAPRSQETAFPGHT